MSTRRWIDYICVAALILALLLTAVMMNGEALGVQPVPEELGYESRLFDTSVVHTLDIVMDDWDEFIAGCEDEEYAPCSVVIDGEAYKNVGLRAKGNTSLSSVSAMDSDRYSFKLEFDQYDSTKSYYGLDKLSLNNLIQDNTFMKDYLTYQMMGEFGVAAPLCSYVYITVNGEDWGLYLAVEGVEDAFLRRNYGSDYGELYKPDSLSMGGGVGNGRNFDFSEFSEMLGEASGEAASDVSDAGTGGRGGGRMPGGMAQSGGASAETGEASGSVPALPGGEAMPEGFDPSAMPGGEGGGMEMPDGGFGGMGSSDVKLQYSDDDPDSYANIFDNAKTDVTRADQDRLIASLKTLNEGTDVESAVAVEDVIRYFVVHNFVVNGDSYTGSMVHNYYLYEEDGRLSMIPWDYNLAYGTFQGGSASGMVNDPIDSPVSGGSVEDRPMVAWIFRSEEYTQLYHQYFQEFLDTVDAAAIAAETAELIAPYVEKDPSKFCTAEEFQAGTAALQSFCRLRAESVAGQLAGEIPSTSEGQSADPSALVDTGGLNLSDMGTMGNAGMGGGRGNGGWDPGGMGASPAEGESGETAGFAGQDARPQMPDNGQIPNNGQMPDNGQIPNNGQMPGNMVLPSGEAGGGTPALPDGAGEASAGASNGGALVWLAVSLAALLAGLVIAFRYKR